MFSSSSSSSFSSSSSSSSSDSGMSREEQKAEALKIVFPVTAEADSIPDYFKKEKRPTRDQFNMAIRAWWKKTILREYPGQCESVAANNVAEQAWKNYAKACDFFDRKQVVKDSYLGIPSSLSDDLNQIYLDYCEFSGYLGPRDYLFIQWHRDKKKLLTLSQADKDKMKATIDMPCYRWKKREPLELYVSSNTCLISQISNSEYERAMSLIELGADVNQYSARYGNTALLLAVSKGWNHQDSENFMPNFFSRFYPQREIIKCLLKQKADVNAVHLVNGMTALHIACLRGDDPELIILLFNNRANLNATDYEGRTPLDLLNLDYESAQKIINQITTTEGDRHWRFGDELPENKSYTATLPTRKHRIENQAEIKKLLLPLQDTSVLKNSSVSS